jgi:glycosidase
MAAQMDDPDSVRSFYKTMIALRAESDVLKFGEFRLISATRHLFIYERELNGQIYRIILNFSKKAQKAPCNGTLLLSNYSRKTYEGTLSPYEAVILDKGDRR